MKPHIPVLLLSLALALPAVAQKKADDHSAHHPAASAKPGAAAAAEMSDGEVRKVDKAAGKITLRHGELKSLDMPPMTMVFTVRDKAVLETLKPGDKVKFKAIDDAGTLTVTEIQVTQ